MGYRELSWREAEQLSGRRLDRRRKYAVGGGWFDEGQKELLELVRWTAACTGCFEPGECGQFEDYYRWDAKTECRVGAGCDECGYTGKRRAAQFLPVRPACRIQDVEQTVTDSWGVEAETVCAGGPISHHRRSDGEAVSP